MPGLNLDIHMAALLYLTVVSGLKTSRHGVHGFALLKLRHEYGLLRVLDGGELAVGDRLQFVL